MIGNARHILLRIRSLKIIILRIIRLLGGRKILLAINRGLRRVLAFTHRAQYQVEWGVRPVPNYFDHYLDLHYFWHKTRTPLCWERGIFGLLAIRKGANLLELCCGDGFNSFYFYSIRAGSITAVDLDREAIDSAKHAFCLPNLNYLVADIRFELPDGPYDNIVWDASLEYFTEIEIVELMKNIKSRLRHGGILSGYSIVQQVCQEEHKYVFKTKDDLLSFLQPYFQNVRIFETIYPSRHNLYFFAGDGELPFDESWPLQTVFHGDLSSVKI